MRSAFIIFKRGKVWYARFVNPDGKSFTKKSVNCLYSSLYGIGKVKITKDQAYSIAQEALDKGIVFQSARKKGEMQTFCCQIILFPSLIMITLSILSSVLQQIRHL